MTADKSSDESYKLKEIVRTVGRKLIREKLAQYIKELRQGKLFFLTVIHIQRDEHNKVSNVRETKIIFSLFVCLVIFFITCDFINNSRSIWCMCKAISNDFNK